MKLWVDDERQEPKGWTRVYTAVDALALLRTDEYLVEEISLDHDLGDKEHDPEWTGYTVLQFIESRVVFDSAYHAPQIRIHTANPAARTRMEAAVVSIERYMQMKEVKGG